MKLVTQTPALVPAAVPYCSHTHTKVGIRIVVGGTMIFGEHGVDLLIL